MLGEGDADREYESADMGVLGELEELGKGVPRTVPRSLDHFPILRRAS